ncbi:MAG: TnpV protein [Oscillospiraceae bacterium]|nr:TnpV protein [Oscillospiraceae bacterium]
MKTEKLTEHYTNERTGISYTLQGDYYLPDLKPAEEEYEIGIWGMRYLSYIKEHRKVFYTNLLTTGKLNAHLAEIDERAQKMMELLIKQIAEREGVDEVLKEPDQIEWVRRMNNIKNSAREIVQREILEG